MFTKLVKLNIKSTFQNTLGKNKKGAAGLVVLFVFVFAYVVAAMGLGAWNQAQLYVQYQLPLEGLLISGALPVTLLIFMASFFGLHQMLFSPTDYELLASLPIKTSVVCLARIFAQYLMYVLYVLMLYVPYVVVYFMFAPISVGGVCMALAIVFLLPLFPVTISELFALLIGLVGSNKKVFRVIRTVVMLLVVVGMVMLYSGFGNATMFMPNIFFFQWIALSISSAQWLPFLAFVGVSILPFTVLMVCIAKWYTPLYERFHRTPAVKTKANVQLQNKSFVKLLWKKEWQKLTSSTGYFLNSCLGLVFYILMPVVLYFSGVGGLGFSAIGVVCLATSILGLNSPLAITFSMEGNSFYIMKSLPVPPKTYVKVKVWLQLSLWLPFALVGTILCCTLMRIVWYETLLCVVYALGFSFLVAGFALFLARKYYTFSYTNEMQVVKQSSAVLYHMLSCFAWMGVVLGVCIGALYVMPLWIPLLVFAVLVTVLGIWLVHKQMRMTTQQLNEIM